jgi:hypothetical protein
MIARLVVLLSELYVVRLTPASTPIFTLNTFCAKVREGILHAKVVVLQQHCGSPRASSAAVGSRKRRDRERGKGAGELPSSVPRPLEEKGERVCVGAVRLGGDPPPCGAGDSPHTWLARQRVACRS